MSPLGPFAPRGQETTLDVASGQIPGLPGAPVRTPVRSGDTIAGPGLWPAIAGRLATRQLWIELYGLPGYGLTVEPGKGGEPLLRMRRIDGKDGAERRLPDSARPDEKPPADLFQRSAAPVSLGKHPPAPASETPAAAETASETINASALIRRAIAGVSDAATRGFITDETFDHLRETCPGWDLHALHAEFERWVNADATRLPANWQKAFIGWVRRHHEKNRHTLRR